MKFGHSDMHGLGNSAGNKAVTAAESTGKPPPASIIYQLHGLIRQKNPTSHYVCLHLMYVARSRPANKQCHQIISQNIPYQNILAISLPSFNNLLALSFTNRPNVDFSPLVMRQYLGTIITYKRRHKLRQTACRPL